jgi:DNA uptake protein ComE-like DNA-binding protein
VKPLAWSVSQRIAIIALLAGMSIYLIFRMFLFPVYVSDPQPLHPSREHELADRIDPNTADWPTLAALPLIGDKRAQDIVAYRDRFTKENSGRAAFLTLNDLRNIRGIGTATIQTLDPYLIFPGQTPETLAPATQQ